MGLGSPNPVSSLFSSAASRYGARGAGVPAATRLATLMHASRDGTGSMDITALEPLLESFDQGNGRVEISDLPADVQSVFPSILPQADANNDGQVDMNDLRELVRELQLSSGTTNVDLSELSDEARQTLMSSAAGRDGSGHHMLSSNSPLEPIRMRLRETAAGESILRGLDANGDTEISAQELAVAWTSLRSLAQNPDFDGDGKLTLADLPPWIAQPLVENYDADGDGKLTSADLADFLSFVGSDTTQEVINSLDTNDDGIINLNDVPPDLAAQIARGGDRNNDGLINISDLPDGVSEQFLHHLDQNGDGQIDSQDVPPELGRAVLSAMADADGTDGNRLSTQTVSQYLGNDALSWLDTYDDKVIDVDDLTVTQSREMVTALLNRNGGGSIKLDDLPQGTGEALLRQMDDNHDGQIDANEIPSHLQTVLAALSTTVAQMKGQDVATSSIDTASVDAWITDLAAADVSEDDEVAASYGIIDTRESAGGGAFTVVLVLLLLGVLAAGFYYWKKQRKSSGHQGQRLNDQPGSHMMPAEVSMPLPSTCLAQPIAARGDEPVVIAHPV